MPVVKVELHSAITGKVSEIANMVVYNDGTGDRRRGNYGARIYRAGTSYFNKPKVIRNGVVQDYPRKSLHVWNLIARALDSAGYR